MSTESMQARLERLDMMIATGGILRHQWIDGHGRACLLAALAPECGIQQEASACPAEVMAPWLAELTPDLDDNTSDEHWPDVVSRYAYVARRWSVLDGKAWRRAKYRVLVACLDEDAKHTTDEGELNCIALVRDLCMRVISGDCAEPPFHEWKAAEDAAWTVGNRVARWVASSYCRKPAGVAYAASCATWGTKNAAGTEASWDRIADATLAILEDECSQAEHA
jgi:hypothetical protein